MSETARTTSGCGTLKGGGPFASALLRTNASMTRFRLASGAAKCEIPPISGHGARVTDHKVCKTKPILAATGSEASRFYVRAYDQDWPVWVPGKQSQTKPIDPVFSRKWGGAGRSKAKFARRGWPPCQPGCRNAKQSQSRVPSGSGFTRLRRRGGRMAHLGTMGAGKRLPRCGAAGILSRSMLLPKLNANR